MASIHEIGEIRARIRTDREFALHALRILARSEMGTGAAGRGFSAYDKSLVDEARKLVVGEPVDVATVQAYLGKYAGQVARGLEIEERWA